MVIVTPQNLPLLVLSTFYHSPCLPFSAPLIFEGGGRERRRNPPSSHRERKLAPEILRRLFPSRGGSRRRLLFYASGSAASRSSSRRFPRMDCARVPNPFRLCSALRVLGSFMVLLVLAIVALSYYAVVVVAWGPRLFHGLPVSILASAVIVVFHLLLALLIWSYFMVVFHDPGSVPVNWRPSLDEESLDRTISVTQADHVAPDTRASTSSTLEECDRRPNISYCTRCQNGKPPRCHHCSVCQRCVLKMDHHCVWVVNCVGAQNYKFFLLFLLYTFLETVLDSFALLPNFIKFFADARKHSGSPGNLAVTFLAFVLNLAFALSLLCFVVMHTSLVLSNTTTIEVYEKKKTFIWKYDLGKRKNFEQVFGTKKLLWFLPLFSTEDLEKIPALQGVDFPTRSDVER